MTDRAKSELEIIQKGCDWSEHYDVDFRWGARGFSYLPGNKREGFRCIRRHRG